MSIKSGFFNSSNGDRKYSAEDFSSVFDGIINDGIFKAVGGALQVVVSQGLSLTVKSGRAWFNRTWLYSDSDMIFTLSPAETLQDRIDAIVIEVNQSSDVREDSLKVIKGVPSSSSPSLPAMVNSELIHQYPIAYIYVKEKATILQQSNVTDMRGTDECPFARIANQIGDKDISTAVDTLREEIANKANRATTLAGYGISDCKIDNGTITIGKAVLTPLTAASDLSASKMSGTFGGAVVANAIAVSSIGISQLRNISIGTEEKAEGSDLAAGEIYIQLPS